MNEAESIAVGNAALRVGDWSMACGSFRQALESDDSPQALYGLGVACWWLGDMRGTLTNLEQAYLGFRDRADSLYAAACALRIGFHYRAHLANASAANEWMARGTRLIEERHLEPLRGELLLMKAYHADDPHRRAQAARESLETARQSGNRDLEVCALSMIGASLVEGGQAADGLAMLDEAMAGCVGGETGNLDTVVFTTCTTLVACTRCAEFERATRWVRAADRFSERYGCPFFHAVCRTIHGNLLFATGQWDRAEDSLQRAIALARDSVPALHAEAVATLAQLRLAQGRLEDAERLVLGFEDHAAVVPVLARSQLYRGLPAFATETAQGRLDAIGQDRLESAPLIEVLGEAALAAALHESAGSSAAALLALGARLGCGIVTARGERLQGCALLPSDTLAGRQHIDRALMEFVRLNMPYETARTHRMLADALRHTQPEFAENEARAALAAFESLGANGEADATAALLRKIGVKVERVGPRRLGILTKREQEVLGLLGQGLSNPQIAERLSVSRTTVEHHVAHVVSKLGLRNRAEAAAEAVRRLEQPH